MIDEPPPMMLPLYDLAASGGEKAKRIILKM